jgi:ketopantoate hydroxymethyltransferase
MQRAFAEYRQEVTAGQFPSSEHSIEMPDEEWQEFLKCLPS